MACIKTKLRHKLYLLGIGVILAFIIVESSLQFGGWLLRVTRDNHNRKELGKANACRILCLGESTTVGQYPRFLGEELNKGMPDRNFSVIDGGIGGTTTGVIVSQLEDTLKTYKPDIVVTMMGINDQGVHIPPGFDTAKTGVPVFRNLKTYKLIKLLLFHMQRRLSVLQSRVLERQSKAFFSSRVCYADQLTEGKGEQVDARSYYDRAMEFYEKQMYSMAELYFKQAITDDPADSQAYLSLMKVYRETNQINKVEETVHTCLCVFSHDGYVLCECAWFLQAVGKLQEALDVFQLSLAESPRNWSAYVGMGRVYEVLGDRDKATRMFYESVGCPNQEAEPYIRLITSLMLDNRDDEAQQVIQQAVSRIDPDYRIYYALGMLYEKKHMMEDAQKYYRKANELHPPTFPEETKRNYHVMRDTLRKRGILYVCAQYPMRPVSVLRALFKEDDAGIAFVDNEFVFKSALQGKRYGEYFEDMFAGDFGHCTEKGNRLLAKNIADTILREVFHQ